MNDVLLPNDSVRRFPHNWSLNVQGYIAAGRLTLANPSEQGSNSGARSGSFAGYCCAWGHL